MMSMPTIDKRTERASSHAHDLCLTEPGIAPDGTRTPIGVCAR